MSKMVGSLIRLRFWIPNKWKRFPGQNSTRSERLRNDRHLLVVRIALKKKYGLFLVTTFRQVQRTVWERDDFQVTAEQTDHQDQHLCCQGGQTVVPYLPGSRQSAKLFSSSLNWESPTPSAAGECVFPSFGWGGRGGVHTRLRERSWGGPILTRGQTLCTVCTL